VRFSKSNCLNQKKGISSIVGGIFFLVLMTSGFTVYYVALDSQSQMLNTQQLIADQEVAKIKEKFVVAASTDPLDNYRLSVQVANIGNNHVEVADMWIINKTDANEPAQRYELDYRDASIPNGYGGNILENTPLYLDTNTYDIKVISSLGTIKTIEYDADTGSNLLSAQMVAIPQDVRFGENVTIALIVTNGGTEPIDAVVESDLTPLDVSPDQCRNTPNEIFTGPTNLLPSQSTMFFWDCVLDSPIGNTITFQVGARGYLDGTTTPIYSNPASDSVIVRDFTGGEAEEVVLKDELFGKPELLLMFPNPMGWDDNDRALWGVMVANPTDQPIDVSKVVIIVISPRPNSDDKIFAVNCHNKGNHMEPVTVSPTRDEWYCPEGNQLQWQDLTNPQTIQPRSVFPFLVQIGPETVGSATGEANNIAISATVFSTLGQFGKSGYVTTMNKEKISMPNVYLSTEKESVSSAHMLGELRSIDTGSLVKFNATLADMNDDAYQINAGSRLIVNIPKDWTFGSILSQGGFVDPVVKNDFPDGSTQLIGTLILPLTGDIPSNDDAKTIQFTATAPDVSKAKMYVMHILGDGTATGQNATGTGNYAIGPIAEAVIQVCPTTGGPQPECPL